MGQKIFGPKELRTPKNWVEIRSVTAEILLILKNVARTNVPLRVNICERWSQEPTFKVLSRSFSCKTQTLR